MSTFSLLYCIRQLDSMLPCVCSVIDHTRRQNVGRTSVTHSPNGLFCVLTTFDFICGLVLKRRTATWNVVVKSIYILLVLSISRSIGYLLQRSFSSPGHPHLLSGHVLRTLS